MPESDATAPPPRGLPLRWLLVPLVALALAEGMARLEVGDHYWYEDLQRRAAALPVDALVVGSSVSEAAVDPGVLARALEADTGRPWRIETMANGGATLAVHHLALRNLLDRHPGALEGTVVLIEAPHGLPSAQTWRQPWTAEAVAYNLDSQLRARDLPAYLASGATAEAKARTMVLFPLLGLRCLLFRQELQRKTLRKLEVVAVRHARARGLLAPEAPRGTADLRSGGGIRTASEEVAQLRDRVRAEATRATPPPPTRDWDATVLADLQAMLRAHGARVAVFWLPASPYRRLHVAGEAGRVSRGAFDRAAARWSLLQVDSRLETSEQDYPDGIHLRASLAPRFSRLLAAALARGLAGI